MSKSSKLLLNQRAVPAAIYFDFKDLANLLLPSVSPSHIVKNVDLSPFFWNHSSLHKNYLVLEELS